MIGWEVTPWPTAGLEGPSSVGPLPKDFERTYSKEDGFRTPRLIKEQDSIRDASGEIWERTGERDSTGQRTYTLRTTP